jgi:hypothetical protein
MSARPMPTARMGAGAGAICERTAMLWRFFFAASMPAGASAHRASTRRHMAVRRNGAIAMDARGEREDKWRRVL